MGNPLSPILCNLFMEHFEKELIPKLNVQPIVWYRYVDDVFSMWAVNNKDFDEFFTQLNKLHNTIKFKVEWEADKILPFLDVKVIRVNAPIFSVYRKPTNSESYIHYFSYHGPDVKKSILVTFFLRAYRICDMCTRADEINHINRSFIELKYPLWFIDECHEKAKKIFYKPRDGNKK